MVWIYQLHLKEKAFKHGNCKNDPDCRYSLGTRGWRKGGIGKYLLERVVLLNGQRLPLKTEQRQCRKSSFPRYQTTPVVSFRYI